MSSVTKYVLAAAAAATLSAWHGAALADSLSGSQDETRSVVVRFADLDLNQSKDVQILYHRINLAAGFACGQRELTGSRLPLPSKEPICCNASLNLSPSDVRRWKASNSKHRFVLQMVGVRFPES